MFDSHMHSLAPEAEDKNTKSWIKGNEPGSIKNSKKQRNNKKQALYAIVFSLGFTFEVKTGMLRTQITYFNPI